MTIRMLMGKGRQFSPGGGGGFQGAGDIVSGARAWWGLRAYTGASIGGNAIKLRRDSDNTTSTFVTIAGGGLDLASITTFKGAANLFVDTLYDQTLNGLDLSQVTLGNQPGFLLNAIGGTLPAMTFNGALTQCLTQVSATAINQLQPATSSIFAFNTGTGAQGIVLGIPTYNAIGFTGSGSATIYAGTNLSATAADSTWHAMQGVFNGGPTSSDMNLNGTPNVGDAGANAANSAPTLGALSSGTQQFTGRCTEAGYWGGAFSPTNSSNVSTNQHAYYGV